MKQLIVILLALLLTGCIAVSPAEVTDTQPQVQPTAPQDTTEPPALEESGTYFADSAVEARTDGAIRAFDVGINDCSAVYPMGDGILLFSGSDVTTLTVLTGEALCIGEQKTLECLLSPESGSVQIGDNGIAYFDSSRNVVIFLDTDLRETRRVKLPDIIQGSAVIAPDWSTVYYCTENAVNVLDMHTGLSRLLKEHEAVQQILAGMYFDGSVLRCDLENEDQVQRTIYLSALTGETL